MDKWRQTDEGIEFAETGEYVERVEDVKQIYRQAWGKELGLR